MHFKYCLVFVFFATCASKGAIAFKIPQYKFEVLEQGFRVAIPDEIGIKNVAFHINRNRAFKSFEPGEFSEQVSQPVNGFWTYEVKRKLRDDDVLHMWTNVQHNQLVYRRIDGQLSVRAFKTNNNDNNIEPVVSESPPSNQPSPSSEIPEDTSKCKPSQTIVRTHTDALCIGQLIFEETFDGPLNSSRWKEEVLLPLDNGDAEFVLYDTGAEVLDGHLNIAAKLWNNDQPGTDIKWDQLDLGRRCTGNQNRAKECSRHPGGLALNTVPPVISARVNTKESFSFKYGRIDIRAKLPQGDWLVPLLLLEPLINYYGQSDYTSGQIRIAFARGNPYLITSKDENIDGSMLYGGAVLASDATKRDKSLVFIRKDKHLGEDFHVYSLLWTERKLVLQIDGQQYGQVNGGFYDIYSSDLDCATAWKTGEFMAPFDQDFYITLGLSVGGHGDFPDDCVSGHYKKPWINTSPKAAYQFWRKRNLWKPTWINPSLQVDFVRVYAI